MTGQGWREGHKQRTVGCDKLRQVSGCGVMPLSASYRIAADPRPVRPEPPPLPGESMDRRSFLKTSAALSAAAAAPFGFAAEGQWRTFEVKTRVELLEEEPTPARI